MKIITRLKVREFEAGKVLVKENPKLYRPVKCRRYLRGGDLCAISLAGEKIMVQIYRVLRGHYFGTIIFETKLGDDHDLHGGDRVRFRPDQVGRAMRSGKWLN